MHNTLPDGIPVESDYRRLIQSDDFKAMEEFSDNFLATHRRYLKRYKRRWCEDSLHQWSRQWEYPFVLSKVQQANPHESRTRILDAGSGVTFFPYYLSAQYDTADVYCSDYDETLSDVFEHINSGMSKRVEFSASDLRNLPYENGWFDTIYCISVMEHTGEYEKIIEEFFRILRPGGTLVVTFDISLDGTRAISVDGGSALLAGLMKRFEKDKDLSLDLNSHLSKPEILTTLSAQEIDASLLPWKFPPFVHRIKASIAARRIVSWPPPVSVFCVGLTRRCA